MSPARHEVPMDFHDACFPKLFNKSLRFMDFPNCGQKDPCCLVELKQQLDLENSSKERLEGPDWERTPEGLASSVMTLSFFLPAVPSLLLSSKR